jgi:acyl carrier protein
MEVGNYPTEDIISDLKADISSHLSKAEYGMQELGEAIKKTRMLAKALEVQHNEKTDPTSVEYKVHKVLMETLGVTGDDLHKDALIMDDLGADSLDVIELIMAFETVFEITIEDNEINHIHTIQDVIDLCHRKRR